MSEGFPIMQSGYRYRDDDSTVSQVRASGGFFAVVAMPWDLMAAHEKQAKKNHGQTLRRLAERGGLSACEAVAVLEDRGYWDVRLTEAQAHAKLFGLLRAHQDCTVTP